VKSWVDTPLFHKLTVVKNILADGGRRRVRIHWIGTDGGFRVPHKLDSIRESVNAVTSLRVVFTLLSPTDVVVLFIANSVVNRFSNVGIETLSFLANVLVETLVDTINVFHIVGSVSGNLFDSAGPVSLDGPLRTKFGLDLSDGCLTERLLLLQGIDCAQVETLVLVVTVRRSVLSDPLLKKVVSAVRVDIVDVRLSVAVHVDTIVPSLEEVAARLRTVLMRRLLSTNEVDVLVVASAAINRLDGGIVISIDLLGQSGE